MIHINDTHKSLFQEHYTVTLPPISNVSSHLVACTLMLPTQSNQLKTLTPGVSSVILISYFSITFATDKKSTLINLATMLSSKSSRRGIVAPWL